jgi:uncharacterized protein YfaS (alpha-2-macroglobulin family)
MNSIIINVASLTEVFLAEQAITTVTILIDGGVGMAVYTKGAVVRLSAMFKQNNTPLDPSIVRVRIKDPNGKVTQYVYGNTSDVIRESIGLYHYDLSLPQSGRWFYKFESSGNGQAAAEGSVEVTPSDF